MPDSLPAGPPSRRRLVLVLSGLAPALLLALLVHQVFLGDRARVEPSDTVGSRATQDVPAPSPSPTPPNSAGERPLAPVTHGERERVAGQIRAYFDAHLPGMGMSASRHYASVMYRATGEPRYVRPVALAVLADSSWLIEDLAGVGEPAYLAFRYRTHFDALSEGTKQKRRRKAFWESWQRELYDATLLGAIYEWDQLGLGATSMGPALRDGQEYLAAESLDGFLLDRGVLENHPTVAVNGVYHLYWLGLADIRSRLRASIQAAWLEDVEALDDDAFQDLLDALTHVVFGESNGFQQRVEPDVARWVLDVFQDQSERVYRVASPAQAAEIGLCFALAGASRAAEPPKLAPFLVASFDPDLGYIPRTWHDIDNLEYRNVIAWMYLRAPGSLNAGPNLAPRYAALLDLVVKDYAVDSH